MIPHKSTTTLTFGDCAENHAGMEQIGSRMSAGSGYSLADLIPIYKRFKELGAEAHLYRLNFREEHSPAYLLHIKNAAAYLGDVEELQKEQAGLEDIYDKKAFMRGEVKNKRARWNLCFTRGAGHGPFYAEGKGTVVSYDVVPHLKRLYEQLPAFFGPKATGLEGEANYYYDVSKCGIGYHGDTERCKVVALRLGATMPICFQWYHRSEPVGPQMRFEIGDGDMYVMSEKAVGNDWRSPTKWTLRHAAGCDAYTKIKR
jgi:hypothetical protein